jgi:drug/metabolite transporter (DMT)-like permease
MMLTYRVAVVIFFIGLASIASSQLIIKWRYGVIGPTLGDSPAALDIARAVISDRWLWLAAVLIGTGVITWYTALVRLPLTFMFPVAGMVSPVVATGAHVLLAEPLSTGQMGAILMIAIGVALLGLLK